MLPLLGNRDLSQTRLLDFLSRPNLTTFKTVVSPLVFLHRLVMEALDNWLFIIEYLSLGAGVLSFFYHRELYLGIHDFSTTQEYFMFLFPRNGSFFRESNTWYTPIYKESNYHIGSIINDFGGGLSFVHRVILGVSFLEGELIPTPNPKNIFCNLYNFPEVLEAASTKAAPSSYCSIYVLSISTFLWGAYLSFFMQVCLLAKRLPRSKALLEDLEKLMREREVGTELYLRSRERIFSQYLVKGTKTSRSFLSFLDLILYSLMFLLSLFGLYAIKPTNIDMDSHHVCSWEIMKIVLISISGVILQKLTYKDLFQ